MTTDDPIPLDDELDWRRPELHVYDIGAIEDAEKWLDNIAGHPGTDPTMRVLATAAVAMLDRLREQSHAQFEILELLRKHHQ